jgi:hypothetical protein
MFFVLARSLAHSLARLRAANHLFLFCTVGMFNIYLSSNTPFSSYGRINFEVVKIG